MKKGFTLIELLAVIVILAVITLIATPIVLSIIKDTKESAVLRSADFYLDGVEKSIATSIFKNVQIKDGIYSIIKDGNICLEYDEDNETCKEKIKVKIAGEVPISGTITITSGKITAINLIYSSGNVILNKKGELVLDKTGSESICKLINGAPNKVGSKYQCKVKNDMEEGFEEGYYFFVLGTNEDGTINLIMERNIYYDSINDVGKVATEESKGLVAWYATSENHYNGPVTAMTYLHNATKDWNNIPNIIMNYEDENINRNTHLSETVGFGSIKTIEDTTTIIRKSGSEVIIATPEEPLKARMPRYDEVVAKGKCIAADNNDAFGSCPLWLSNFLSNTIYVKGEELQNITGIDGYWTLSTDASNSARAWVVHKNGLVNYNCNVANDAYYGVRPVITIKF